MSDSHREKNAATSGTYVIISIIALLIILAIVTGYILIDKLF